ncbi:MAG TPA: response regulator [Thermoanaerobaculia bacterium]|nr:response regulator [Thermoanaerobaculia bacterium]HUM30395.1 response regulator [Thermoanaerobaculia bacterium]HXK68594.1 response regulator [Thermoanaerobaculia bacterium]
MTARQESGREHPRVLIVDDQVENLDLLEEILSIEGFSVDRASGGLEALRRVDLFPPDCIILDIMMPGMDGFEVCQQLKGKRPTCFIPVIMFTALSEVTDKVRGLEAGADDFLNKPVSAPELLARVRTLIRIKQLRDELDTSETIIVSMIQALEMKDPTSVGHSERVALAAARTAKKLNLPLSTVETIAKAAILHDIGKIGLPDHVLWPEGALSEEDKRIFCQHSDLGAMILAPLLSFGDIRMIIRRHHERLDGSGYPEGISGASLSLPAEIVAIANRYDDLYMEDGQEEAIRKIKDESSRGLFHEDLTAVFLNAAVYEANPEESLESIWTQFLPVPGSVPNGKILVADDTPSNREVVEEILADAGHTVHCVGSGDALLRIMEDYRPDLVILDIRMPGLDGFEVCRRIKGEREWELLPVILVTARREVQDRRAGMEAGADDFLLLPLHRLEVVARVKSLLRQRFFYLDLEQHQSVILSLASALEAKDPYTRGHSDRVAQLSVELAMMLNLSNEDLRLLSMAGKLHDIGKIGVPEKLLNKPGRLTGAELETIMTHPAQGQLICKQLKTVQSILPIIRHHHERFDGSGYPDGLVGDEIPYLARILGMADAYDAMTSDRPYRAPMEVSQALAVLEDETSSGKWDPRIFRILTEMVSPSTSSS